MADSTKLTESEQELVEAMKAAPETEAEDTGDDYEGDDGEAEGEVEEPGPKRGPDGKFAKKEAEADDEGDDESEGEEAEPEVAAKPGMVPLQALASERQKRQEVDAEAAQLRAELNELRQMVSQFQQPQQHPQQAPDEMPDPVLDPDAFKAWFAKREQALREPYAKQAEEQQRIQQQRQQIGELVRYAEAHEKAFKAEHADKDYEGALNFARQKVAESFRLMGEPEDRIPALVQQQELQTAAMAYERGINPAAYVYNYAKSNGFAEKARDDDNIERLDDARRRTASTASAGGSARADEVTAESLARMSPEKLADFAKKNPEAFKRAMGA